MVVTSSVYIAPHYLRRNLPENRCHNNASNAATPMTMTGMRMADGTVGVSPVMIAVIKIAAVTAQKSNSSIPMMFSLPNTGYCPRIWRTT